MEKEGEKTMDPGKKSKKEWVLCVVFFDVVHHQSMIFLFSYFFLTSLYLVTPTSNESKGTPLFCSILIS
jgi:hypothetical protein